MFGSNMLGRVSAQWLAPAIASMCVSMTACRSTVGSISDGRYTAPENVLSLPVPKLSMGEETRDGTDKDPKTGLRGGFVTFYDEFGDVRSVEYEDLPPEQAGAMSDPEGARRYLNAYVHDVHLHQLEARFPGTRTISEEFITLSDGTPAWFAVFFIPGGSTLTVTSAEYPQGRRLDSTRAYLFLQHKLLFLTLSTASDLTGVLADNNAKMTEKPPDLEQMKSVLTGLYESIRF
jgi:hypothetical protein